MPKRLDEQDHTVVAWHELAELRRAAFELTVLKLALQRVATTNPSVYMTIKAAQAQIDSELPF